MKLYFLTRGMILGFATLLPVAIKAGSSAASGVGPANTYFVTQTSLGTPFQVDSGRLAETRGTTRAIQSYTADGEFTHRRKQCTISDSEEQGASAGTYTFENSLLHDGFHPSA
jgi:predicted outer membrane protein